MVVPLGQYLSSASEVSSGDDDCPDIMSDSDTSSDENIVWLTMSHCLLKSASLRRPASAARTDASDDSSDQSCWSLISGSSDDTDSDHSTVSLSRPRAHNKRPYPARRLKTAALNEHVRYESFTIPTQVTNYGLKSVMAKSSTGSKSRIFGPKHGEHTEQDTVPAKVLPQAKDMEGVFLPRLPDLVNRIDLPNHALDDLDKPEKIEECDRHANKCFEFDRSGLRQLAKEAIKSEADLAQLEALIEGRAYDKQKHRIMKVDPIKLYPLERASLPHESVVRRIRALTTLRW
ncbi:hypothetical protein SARC_12482 [Sphaeroforma arctica JP610]|uniref:Uncharacterized protein n=1 Tax=Sphaeroforma arctica JP610 TaxID=667725 RepID=A0A0L0FG09_9EUKA|nr:hypothetical protein SARC_12482 [Sphaeroforma arctica JP610]KNC74983.1 hypothetical protein SARC_12482 [Sphaeroforma arctica JP610]|eukprot:XP_014148885.1 hypothetical protein SARC_12482 [Sphaeroforma arctica JP610]